MLVYTLYVLYVILFCSLWTPGKMAAASATANEDPYEQINQYIIKWSRLKDKPIEQDHSLVLKGQFVSSALSHSSWPAENKVITTWENWGQQHCLFESEVGHSGCCTLDYKQASRLICFSKHTAVCKQIQAKPTVNQPGQQKKENWLGLPGGTPR